LIVGIFSPLINWCGGAEWVAINLISALKEAGHTVILLTNESLNQEKIARLFNRKIAVDQQIVFPFGFFAPTDSHNIYTDFIRSSILKLKCDIMIDTYSNAILPGMNISYIHYPIFNKFQPRYSYLRNKIYYLPYRKYLENCTTDVHNKLFFANSKFIANAVKEILDVESYVLYPPIRNDLLNQKEEILTSKRDNMAVTISRFSPEKNLQIIPYIAKHTRNDISFAVAGLLDSEGVLNSLQQLSGNLGVTKKVILLPNVKRNRLKQLLLNSKVYLHTRVNEPFGISIIEAIASGCIPIVHDSGGPKEFVPEEFRYRTKGDAVEKLERAFDSWSPKKAAEISKLAEKFSEKNFSKCFIEIFHRYIENNLNKHQQKN
jgi:alpha-1,2-mannosyltransferase